MSRWLVTVFVGRGEGFRTPPPQKSPRVSLACLLVGIVVYVFLERGLLYFRGVLHVIFDATVRFNPDRFDVVPLLWELGEHFFVLFVLDVIRSVGGAFNVVPCRQLLYVFYK